MMPDFHLFFWGLICHIDGDNYGSKSDHSAMVQVCNHIPMIVFSKSRFYRLAGNVTFNTPHQFALRDPKTFGTYVPRLREILGGKLETGMAHGTSMESLFIYYPESDERLEERQLRVCNAYDGRTRHVLKGHPPEVVRDGLVGRIHVLQVPTSLRGFTVSFDYWVGDERKHLDEPVSSDGCILFTNVESRFVSDADADIARILDQLQNGEREMRGFEAVLKKGLESARQNLANAQHPMLTSPPNHFEHYSSIVDTPKRAIAVPYGNSPNSLPFPEGCLWVRTYVDAQSNSSQAATHSECGPTGWP